MTPRIKLPSKEEIAPQTPNVGAQKPRTFMMPQSPTTTLATGFERGAVYSVNFTFTYSNQTFQAGEIYEVVGSRRFGPMAALEILFRDTQSGAKKFWVLHHDRHNYKQNNFSRIS